MRQAPSTEGLASGIRSADAAAHFELFQALDYLCAAQLYLRDNVLLRRPLKPSDVKPEPSGHWGVGPPVNWALSFAELLRGAAGECRVEVLHGGGHAGPSALAFAYLSGALGKTYPELRPGLEGLTRLIRRFPAAVPAGGEVTPAIPGVTYMGGELGNALAFAQGRALDDPDAFLLALIGDGECETGATAAAWLGRRALAGKGRHGRVLPVVLLNGMRMGGASLLAEMDDAALEAYFLGLGYQPFLVSPATDRAKGCFPLPRLAELAELVPPIGEEGQCALVVRMPKGTTGPAAYEGMPVTGTAHVHKTPLPAPRRSPLALAVLERWLRSYRPEVALPGGRPSPHLASVLARSAPPLRGAPRPRETPPPRSEELAAAIREVEQHRPLRVFSPDELWSNRIPLVDARGNGPHWVVEVLNEGLCDAWARGFCSDAERSAVVIGYEAFSALAISQIVQASKARRLAREHGSRLGAPVYVLTSLGWQNTFTHRSTALGDWLLVEGPTDARLHFPLWSVGATVARCLAEDAQHFVWYCKHTSFPERQREGFLAVGEGALVAAPEHPPQLAYLSIGDRAALEASRAAALLCREHGFEVAQIALTDLQVAVGDWPRIREAAGIGEGDAPTVVAGILGSRALRAFVSSALGLAPAAVHGFDNSAPPLPVAELAAACGLDAASLARAGASAMGNLDRALS